MRLHLLAAIVPFAAIPLLAAPRALAGAGGGVAPVEDARHADPIRESFVQPSEKAQALDRRLTRYADLGFSGVVFVAKDGLVVLHKGYGVADRSTGKANDARTPFPIGPMGRIFTAAAILRLQMEGRIETSDPVAKYIPDFREDPARPATTVHDLLAGDEAGTARFPEIIEKASGEPFERCLAERLFAPARMRDSWFLGGPPASSVSIARGYTGPDATLRRLVRAPAFQILLPAIARGVRERAARLVPVPPPLGAAPAVQPGPGAGMITTAGDLFLWDLALMGETILSANARTQIFNPIDNTVSYGWKLERTPRGTPRMAATGDLPGYESGYWVYPSDNLVVIVLINNDMGWRDAIRQAAESESLGRDYTLLYIFGGLVLLYLVMQGALRRRVPYRKGRHPRIYP